MEPLPSLALTQPSHLVCLALSLSASLLHVVTPSSPLSYTAPFPFTRYCHLPLLYLQLHLPNLPSSLPISLSILDPSFPFQYPLLVFCDCFPPFISYILIFTNTLRPILDSVLSFSLKLPHLPLSYNTLLSPFTSACCSHHLISSPLFVNHCLPLLPHHVFVVLALTLIILCLLLFVGFIHTTWPKVHT